MSDNGGTGGTSQEGGAGTGQAGQEPTGTEGGNEAPNGNEQGTQGSQGAGAELTIEQILEATTDPAQKTFLAKLAKDAKDARADAGKYRTQYNTEKQTREDLQRKNETDTQRLEREEAERVQRVESLETENRNLRVHASLETAAGTVGAHNPTRVRELLDSRVELDDKGQPTNLQALLTELKRSDPYLFKKANNDGNEGGGNAGGTGGTVGTSMNDFIRGGRR